MCVYVYNTHLQRLVHELFAAVLTGLRALVALVAHVVAEVAPLEPRAALVLAPHDLERTVPLMSLHVHKTLLFFLPFTELDQASRPNTMDKMDLGSPPYSRP